MMPGTEVICADWFARMKKGKHYVIIGAAYTPPPCCNRRQQAHQAAII